MNLEKIYQNKILINGNWLTVGKRNIKLYNLSEEKNYSEDQLGEILYDISIEKAYSLISMKEISSFELKRKLLQYFIYEDIVEKVMKRLKENGYINDDDYIITYIRNKKIGKIKVFYDLMQLGFKKEKIEKVYEKIDLNEKEYLLEYLKKLENKSLKYKISFLMRKGFSMEDIKDNVKENL